jgi:hypothetical protein
VEEGEKGMRSEGKNVRKRMGRKRVEKGLG